MRVVLSDQYRSGWIDNITVQPFPVSLNSPVQGNVLAAPVTNVIHDANTESLYSARMAVLYKPSEDLSVLATAMTQGLHMGGYDLLDGSPDSADPSRVYDAHYEAFPLREGIRDDISIFGLTVKANVGFADLTSATSYFGRLGYQVQDASESLYYSNRTSPSGNPPYRRNAVRSGSIRGTGSVASTQSGNPADLARHRRPGTGWRAPSTAHCIRCGTKSARVR